MNRNTIAAAALAAAASIGALAGAITSPADAATTRHGLAAHSLPPCTTEAGPGPCVWRGNVRGDRRGRSFWIGGYGKIHYVSDRHARRLVTHRDWLPASHGVFGVWPAGQGVATLPGQPGQVIAGSQHENPLPGQVLPASQGAQQLPVKVR